MSTNIPQNVVNAIIYIIALDDLQLSQGSGGVGTFKWNDWHWTQAESQFWSDLRAVVEPLLEDYSNKRTITSEERDEVKQAIKSARKYVSYDVTGHRLLLKIAAFGDNHDWETANVKLGTPRAKKPGKGKSDSTAMKQPQISIKMNIMGEQLLSGVNPDTPHTIKLPAGMKFLKFYRFVGSQPPTSISQYIFVGNAYRGKLSSKFSGLELQGQVKIYAYYIARYESNKGELGEPCAMISAEVLF